MEPPKENYKVYADAPRRDCIPSMTLDILFCLVFSEKEFLKSFLNGVYGYKKDCFINDIVYLRESACDTSPFWGPNGTFSSDFSCICKLNVPDRYGVKEFAVEILKERQSVHVNKCMLEVGTVMDNGFLKKKSNKPRSAMEEPDKKITPPEDSSSQEPKYEGISVRYLFIFRRSFVPSWGWKYHIVPFAAHGELEYGYIDDLTLKPATENGSCVMKGNQMYTIIQLEEYFKRKGKIEDRSDFMFKDWLDVISLDLDWPDINRGGFLKMYRVPEIESAAVNRAVEFVKKKLQNSRVHGSITKQTMNEDGREDIELACSRYKSEIRERNSFIEALKREVEMEAQINRLESKQERLKKKNIELMKEEIALVQKMFEDGVTEEKVMKLLKITKEELEDSKEDEE